MGKNDVFEDLNGLDVGAKVMGKALSKFGADMLSFDRASPEMALEHLEKEGKRYGITEHTSIEDKLLFYSSYFIATVDVVNELHDKIKNDMRGATEEEKQYSNAVEVLMSTIMVLATTTIDMLGGNLDEEMNRAKEIINDLPNKISHNVAAGILATGSGMILLELDKQLLVSRTIEEKRARKGKNEKSKPKKMVAQETNEPKSARSTRMNVQRVVKRQGKRGRRKIETGKRMGSIFGSHSS